MIKNIRYYFFVGLFSVIPIGATFWLISWVLNIFSGPGQKLVNEFLYTNVYINWILSMLLTIIVVVICGYIVSSVFGRLLFLRLEKFISTIPVVNTLYQTIKSITESISSSDNQAFQKVVFLEYPRKGIWTIALVTGESKNKNGQKFYHLYLPTTPNPTSGYMLYISVDDVIETDMSSEEAIKIIISGGAMSPKINEL